MGARTQRSHGSHADASQHPRNTRDDWSRTERARASGATQSEKSGGGFEYVNFVLRINEVVLTFALGGSAALVLDGEFLAVSNSAVCISFSSDSLSCLRCY
jgi:hypothetical protein